MAKKRISDLQEALPLFAATDDSAKVHPPFDPKELAHLAAQGVFLGTSSWKYRGWEGLIYRGGYTSEAQFQRQSLREYASYFPCVGVDFTFYAFPTPEMVAYLLEVSLENFRYCPKVTKRITMAEFPNHGSYGKWAGQKNPEFLNADVFEAQFLKPMTKLAGNIGSVVFEFTHLEAQHLPQVERFFEKISRPFPMSIELRSPELLSARWYEMLRNLKLAPVFNSWSKMPLLREQLGLFLESGGEGDDTPLVARALLRPGRSYDEAVQRFYPYNKMQEEFTEGREDLVRLIRFALKKQRKLFVLVNNRFEGSAPHTIGAVMDRYRAQVN